MKETAVFSVKHSDEWPCLMVQLRITGNWGRAAVTKVTKSTPKKLPRSEILPSKFHSSAAQFWSFEWSPGRPEIPATVATSGGDSSWTNKSLLFVRSAPLFGLTRGSMPQLQHDPWTTVNEFSFLFFSLFFFLLATRKIFFYKLRARLFVIYPSAWLFYHFFSEFISRNYANEDDLARHFCEKNREKIEIISLKIPQILKIRKKKHFCDFLNIFFQNLFSWNMQMRMILRVTF